MNIKLIQLTTDLKQLIGDVEAGLNDTEGILTSLFLMLKKAEEIKAEEDALSDIEDNEIEMRAEREAMEHDCHASPEDGCKCIAEADEAREDELK